ncbi:MAG TPA: helical backbone metal receptor [Rhodospirillales bacterium]
MAETAQNRGKTTAAQAPRRPLVDAAGNPHARAATGARTAPRIVSLVPSVTELLFALGLGSSVVGRTAFCVHPAGAAKAVASVGGTKRVNLKRLLALKPTHVVVNVDENPKALADDLAGRGIAVVVTHPIEVEDNIALFRLIGGVFGAEQAADDLARRFEATLAGVRAAAKAMPARRVLYLIWKDPWMTVGADTYVSRLLATVNWNTVGAPAAVLGAGKRYPEVALTDATLRDIDLVLFSSEPYAFTAADARQFRAAFPAHAAKARLVDGQLLSWYGSRAILGLEYLVALAHAEAKK